MVGWIGHTYIESDFQMNLDFDGIRTSANRPKRLQWPKRMLLIPERAMLAQVLVMWLLCYLQMCEIKFEMVK